ncbi:hypothetical protein [uncultured Winogradskyella sp.]|uniref:hypothetical protein n=1 Tax=uncultured Winogradskyella sp. TaxID=395353 RepID=UPI00261A858E|nr:hypothetical protein [uncultured Winogradskyella sp.]
MKFNHLFYDSEINFKSISRKKIVLSILLGLVSAIIFYCFFYVVRESDRMMSLDFENRPFIMPESSRYLYNLFFAAISMIVGNSIAISFLVSRPQNVFLKRNIKRSRIINDQVFLGPNFIYLFTKIWFLFGAFAWGFMGSEFLDYYFLPSILIVIVLYLESWKTLITVIKKNRWKIQGIHLIAFVFLTFILSRINVIDYKLLDASILSSNPTIDVPSSFYPNDNYHRYYYYDNLVIKMDFVDKNQVGLFNEENEQIEWQDLYRVILDFKESSYNPVGTWVRLRANKNIPIKYIKEFELILLEMNQWRIIYEVANNDESTASYFNDQLEKHISPSLLEAFPRTGKPPRVLGWDLFKDQKFEDTLSVYISEKVQINNLETPLYILSEKLKSHINRSSIIEYIYGENVTFQEYINVLSAHKMATWEIRTTENFDKIDSLIRRNPFSSDEKLSIERNRIIKKYPFRITERFE